MGVLIVIAFTVALAGCSGDPCRLRHRENMERCGVVPSGTADRLVCATSAQEAFRACQLNQGGGER